MNIDFSDIVQIVVPIITIIFGALSAYFNENEKLKEEAEKYIAEAEEIYKDTFKAGGQKFSWVVESLYKIVPVPLRIVISKKCIEMIVQSTFDNIESYAATQIDKAVNNMEEEAAEELTEVVESSEEKSQ
jgi:H+/gluconate symporter-like permease